MNKMIPIFASVAVFCFFIYGAHGISAAENQGETIVYGTGDPATWPKELDAVIAAPNNHRILLENDRVRVLQVTLAPGELENLHSHRWPSVLYIQSAGDFIDRDSGGDVIFDTRKLDAPLPLPITLWKDPEAPHSVENLSQTTPLRLIRVEIKPD